MVQPPAGDGLEELSAALASVFPGLAVVDRVLELGSHVVELAAVDGEGRLLLVSRVGAVEGEAALFALDALAFARANLPLFARHYPGSGLDPGLAPQVVLLAERFEPALAARLAGIDPAALTCLEIRRLASRERSESYLLPVVPGGATAAPHPALRPADFLEHLSPDLRPTAERVLQRLARLDEDLTASSVGRQMRFALDGEPICTLEAEREALQARVVPNGGAFRIASGPDADLFLEAVLERTLELFEPGERHPKGPVLAPPGGVRPAPEAAAFDPFVPSGAILTPEEIEAFRTPD